MKLRVWLLSIIVLFALTFVFVGGGFAVVAIFKEAIRRTEERCEVFKRLASEVVAPVESEILTHINSFISPPKSNVSRQLYDVLKSVDDLEFVKRITIYLPDPVETNAMWGFTAWRPDYSKFDGFARFYIKMDFEKAMRSAVDGDDSALVEIKNRSQLIWYKVLDTKKGRAVIRVDGNRKAKFVK